ARAGAGAPGAGSEAARAARAGEPAAGIARHATASRGGRAVRLERGAGLPVPARIPQHGAELPEARGGPGGQRVTSGAQGAVLPAVRVLEGVAQNLALVVVLGERVDAVLGKLLDRGRELPGEGVELLEGRVGVDRVVLEASGEPVQLADDPVAECQQTVRGCLLASAHLPAVLLDLPE